MCDNEQVLKEKLTPEQYDAAVDPAEEVLCLACAGSGKSRTLAFRIARLLAQGVNPQSIVAFTFTDKAAESIKRAVVDALAAVGIEPTVLGAMFIGTIHSYCQNVLGEMDAKYRQFDVLDKNRLKLYLISRFGLLGLRPLRSRARGQSYFDTIDQVANAWTTLNDEMISIVDIAANDAELGQALQRLSDGLSSDQFIDFSLMIRLVVDALHGQDAGALRAVHNLQHLMVDEYQDVNPSQEALIKALHARSSTLFVVGDDDQAIYAWRGADVSNILTFADRYQACSTHTLSTNFRSTSAIVDAASAFAAAELGAARIGKTPVAQGRQGAKDFRNLWFDARTDEARWVADRIQSLLGAEYHEQNGTVRGLTPGDFAILMRSTRGVEGTGQPRHAAFTGELDGRGIPYSLEAGGGVFDRPQVRVLRETFELLRAGSPTREVARAHFTQSVLPAFPNADFGDLCHVLSDWGPRIHAPVAVGGARRRVFPQELVHHLLSAFGLSKTSFDEGIMRDLGVFSTIIKDVESVYLSIDTTSRFAEILNFLGNVAEKGYDTSTDDVVHRPDAVTVATVHKMKGLEFPVVFIVDAEAERFPWKRKSYQGWLPHAVIQPALQRGAYQNTAEEEKRLYYTAITRAESFLYISGSENLPGGVKHWKVSPYSQRLSHPEMSDDAQGVPAGLQHATPRQRIDDSVLPTTYSEVRYYLRCPRDYQFRKSFGFNPPISEMFGFGQTVHASICKLHEVFTDSPPTHAEAETLTSANFHLKHVPPSKDPQSRPGAYERARDKAAQIIGTYADDYGSDFVRRRYVERRFEVPVSHAVIAGTIDLMLCEDPSGEIVDASVVDFKTLQGGAEPEESDKLSWEELALQVQLYAKAARDVLGEAARTGAVHLLKDNARVDVPISGPAVDSAVANVEWAVDRILNSDFPMRPHPGKCNDCDYCSLCSKTPELFLTAVEPPAIHVPGKSERLMVQAFSKYEES